MSEDGVREIEEKIAYLKAQLEKLENELEKAREAGKINRIKDGLGKASKGGTNDRGNY